MNFYEQLFSRGRATGEGMTHFERLFAAKFGGSPPPEVREYTGAVPVTITADGTPLLDLLISGNEQHTGTPTPDSPIMPQGCGERTGNLARFYQEEMQDTFYGVDITVKNAEITLNGTVASGSGHWVEIGYKFGGGTEQTNDVVIPCKRDISYTITTEILDGDSSEVRTISFGASNTLRTINIGSSSTTTFSGDINRIFISLGAGGVTFNNLKFRVMFNEGSEALPYEPYGYKIPILSNSTTTPVYLGEVESTRRIIKYEFNGSEAWAKNSASVTEYIYYLANLKEGLTRIDMLCSHLPIATSDISPTNAGVQLFSNKTTLLINVGSDVMNAQPSGNIVDGLKEYLAAQYAAGTPVTVWYVLATEVTAVVNEPLMRIGDYADTLSKTQAGVSIPTNNGSTTVDVDTTVKPSEVYIKYMG